jgi:hypothetical protein
MPQPGAQDGDGTSGRYDPLMVPLQIENLVQAFACDVTRAATLLFWNGDAPIFPGEFPGYDPNTFATTSPFVTQNWHAAGHDANTISETIVPDLKNTYQWFGKMFTLLVQRLAAIKDVDGSRLLDNTLVVWISDISYANHSNFNNPVVLAGMKSAFPKGQGRHVVHARRTTGDLYAHVQRLLGFSDMTYGLTGTLGQVTPSGRDLMKDSGFPNYINASTPLHVGPLDL